MAPKPKAGSAKTNTTTAKAAKTKINNKGVHAKSKTSCHKKSKNYKKPTVGQGKRR